MKKKDFVTLILSTMGGILFALGMCMALLPQWGAMAQGVVIGIIGAVILLAMIPVRRKMDGKPCHCVQRKGHWHCLAGGIWRYRPGCRNVHDHDLGHDGTRNHRRDHRHCGAALLDSGDQRLAVRRTKNGKMDDSCGGHCRLGGGGCGGICTRPEKTVK